MKPDVINFGSHFMLDGYGGDMGLLNDEDNVKKVLLNVLDITEMQELYPPVILRVKGNDLKDPGGITGFLLVKESHISIHTFPKRRFISADVYTCKEALPQRHLHQLFLQNFKLVDTEINYIRRGTKYPIRDLV